MKLKSILDQEKRRKHTALLTKRISRLFSETVESTPVFVLGSQRSGTTMLMNVFHLHPDTDAYDESKDSPAMLNMRLRSYDTIGKLVSDSKARFVCFKPLADCHLAEDISEHFPNGRFIWVYRRYEDNANSAMKRFPHATRAIKIVCRGESGGGFFQEGVTKETERILRDVYSDKLTEFDFGCLRWWARNRLYIEHEFHKINQMILIRYEDLVTDPQPAFRQLFEKTGMSFYASAIRHIHSRSVGKHPPRELTPVVRDMCEELWQQLNALRTFWKPEE